MNTTSRSLVIRVLATSLVFLLFLTTVSLAEPAWVAKYEKMINKTYKAGQFGYWGLADLGTDGSPELFITTGKKGNQKLNFYYITNGGSVRKSSKNIPINKVYTNFKIDIYDERGTWRNVAVIDGRINSSSSKTEYVRYQLSQNSKRTLWLQPLERIKDMSSSGSATSSTKYYWKGKKYSQAKFDQYATTYRNTLSSYRYVGRLTETMYYNINDAISRFRSDAQRFY